MDPIDQLKEEHQNILRGLKILEHTSSMVKDGTVPEEEIRMLLDFFRSYADDGHHAKEEEIFFIRLYEANEGMKSETSPIAVLRDDHVLGRKLIGKISNIDDGYVYHVEDYSTLLKRHIDMEDELFPMLSNNFLTEEDLRIIAEEFARADAQRNLTAKLAIIDKVEVRLL